MKSDRNLDQILESAVFSSWTDLTHGVETGLIHIEYGFAAEGTLDYLKLWSSKTRGHPARTAPDLDAYGRRTRSRGGTDKRSL